MAQPSTGIKCCQYGCSLCTMMNETSPETSLRSIKRKYDDAEEENKIDVRGIVPQVARVEIENERMALRETVTSQQQTIQDLVVELEEERNASSSAANEAMSMILKLQREKAEVQMEARQFKRFVEERMEHDQQETLALEDLLYKKEQTLQSLTCAVQVYKHTMVSYGLTESEADEDKGMSRNMSMDENLDGQYEFPSYEMYPPLKCNINESQVYPDGDYETTDIEKYPFAETPRDQLNDLEYRMNELEQSPKTVEADGDYFGPKHMLEKVIVGQSPRRPKLLRKFSVDSDNARFGGSFKKTVFSNLDLNPNFRKVDNSSEVGDDMSDRIYTIDSIYQGPPTNGIANHNATVSVCDDYNGSPRDSLINSDVSDLEVQKLYARLQALEADRESMRQAIISVGTDNEQLILLKEIAQSLCKEMASSKVMPVQKKPETKSLSTISLFKVATSSVLWRRKARKSKYTFGASAKNEGLQMLLDRGPRIGQRRVASMRK